MIPYTQLSRLLAAADVIAIPQLDTEAGRYQMPMKVYDCMTMAKPIVASAVTDLPLVLEGCGRVVPPSDVHLVRGALRDMLKNPEEAAKLGERARARCLSEFTMERVSESLRLVVEGVAKGREEPA
ncbi:MAG: hypothetical protein DMD94_19160 [Candidatus Rokuibacteriota bacterium]|nr:MAG: hypothetical protein DMD94_19160 [Candidatus Rokubacteria bacterium]